MKEIYVYKPMFGGWQGISKEVAEEKLKEKEGRIFGVELEMDRGENEPLKITLLKDYFGFSGPTQDEMDKLMQDYFTYVESITGMVTYPA